jgi:hypothetical protein
MKRMLVVLCVLTSCSGYRFRDQRNPLIEEGIKSISVPMFINKSSIPNASHVFTTAIVRVLADTTNIKIHMGDDRKADALLIGIIDSPKRYQDLYTKNSSEFVERGNDDDELSKSIGDRASFYIPTSSLFKIDIRLVLIRHPSDIDKELVNSELLPYLQRSQKIIFNHVISREWTHVRSVRGTENVDSAGLTNVPRSRFSFEQGLKTVSQEAANDFRDLVLNVF